MRLRDYQHHAIKSIWHYFEQGNTGNPIVAMPTGTGKSLVIGGFCYSVYQHYTSQRIMMLTHVQELIEQNFEKLVTMWPAAPAGIYSAGLRRKDTYGKITFASIQSVAHCPDLFGHIDLIIIDECHLVSQKELTSYRKFIAALKLVNPNIKVVGLTATPYRLGLGMLTDGGLFTDVCCDMTTLEGFNWFFDQGYLCKLFSKKTETEIDLSGVGIRGGDFVDSDIQEITRDEKITRQALMETIEYGSSKKHWLIFGTGVEHCALIVKILGQMGIPAAMVTSKSTREQRREAIAGFKSGKYRALVNNNVLTTGFDFQAIDLLVILRPTMSSSLWVQMLGRGIRTFYAAGFDLWTLQGRLAAIEASQKPYCLVLDFSGNSDRLGPINDVLIPKKKGQKPGVAPVKICDACQHRNHTSARFCMVCNEEFPVNVGYGMVASDAPLIAQNKNAILEDFKIEVFKVNNVTYQVSKRAGRPDTIKATFSCGLRVFSSHLCLEHGGFAAKQARDYWRNAWHGDPEKGEPPESVAEALEFTHYLKAPTHIRVWLKKKQPEVKAYDFTGTGFASESESSGSPSGDRSQGGLPKLP